MGTRADFYVGRGPTAEWLGSIAWDGYPSGIPSEILHVEDEGAFRRLVAQFLADREDGTKPEMGWPWPWEDSCTTDYAYALDVAAGKVWASCFGKRWFDPTTDEVTVVDEMTPVDFPDMTERKATTYGRRSGVMMIGFSADGRVGPIDPDQIDTEEAAQR